MAYHHGALPEAILAAAATAIEREGVAALSLRALAREVGVTHTAPRHHFGSKRGVVTALAAQGYRLLAQDVRSANAGADFLESGVAYVEFSRTHPAHFSVMFRPDLVDRDDPQLQAALHDLYVALTEGVHQFARSSRAQEAKPATGDTASLARAAWSMAHGFATLARGGNLLLGPGQTEAELARQTLRHLRP